MKKTVRAVLRTRMGIIAVRLEGQELWGFIEAQVLESDASWQHAIVRGLYDATGISALPTQVRRITSRTSRKTDPKRKRQTIYCEILTSDIQILTEIQTRGRNGQEVEEIPYQRARDVSYVRKGMRDFLARYRLLKAPDLQKLFRRR